MPDFIHKIPDIVTLRDIHTESKDLHVFVRTDCDVLDCPTLKLVNVDLDYFLLVGADLEMNGRGVCFVIDKFRIVILNSHIGEPIHCMIFISAILTLDPTHIYLLLPSILKQLIPYIRL